MKEITISPLEAGQRFDKYLVKCLPNATKSFLYKMLRKKNITLNRKKQRAVKSWQQAMLSKCFCR